jgi:hypothetical protein
VGLAIAASLCRGVCPVLSPDTATQRRGYNSHEITNHSGIRDSGEVVE